MTVDNKEHFQILVVDDDPFILSMTVQVLNRLGYPNVDTAANGTIGLWKFISKLSPSYNLVLLDLNMPETDGVQFMRCIRDIDFAGGLIIFSGEDPRMLEAALDLAKTHDLNVLGALPKPMEPGPIQELMDSFKPVPTKYAREPDKPISEEELKEGLEESGGNELVLIYQPKVEIESGKIVGVETLARWNHPERGMLGPEAFVLLAEEIGCMDEMTIHIYRRAVKHNADWHNAGMQLTTSVNFSISSFANLELADTLIGISEELNVDPRRINIEVNQTQVMTEAVDCIELMMRLRLKRFGLSIDDFGTGRSSMSQLKRIPFTEMKIDRAFVNDAGNNSSARAILVSSIDLAKKMNMAVVAEGVESRADWDLVAKLDCEYVQGFYCAKPMPNDEFTRFFEHWTGPH